MTQLLRLYFISVILERTHLLQYRRLCDTVFRTLWRGTVYCVESQRLCLT